MKGVSLAAVLTAVTALLVTVGPVADAHPSTATPGRLVVTDQPGDVGRAKLDIRRVSIHNGPDGLAVRIHFPGVARTYDFPTGAISVLIDSDPTRKGPEYGHFMDFWSDYRFAPTAGWREQPTSVWGHSPEGACVETAGVRSDPGSRLRWFEFLVKKVPGCFDPAGPVRVAVSTLNTGDLDPFVEYAAPAADHLGARHSWTPWVPVG